MSGTGTSEQRVAIVTGGAQGLGQAIAERLARDGAAVVLADVNRDAAEAAAATLRGAGHAASALPIDVSDEGSVAAAFADFDRRHGRLDYLVNSAGVLGLEPSGRKPLVEDMSLALWQKTFDVNVTGIFLACRAAIPRMRKHRHGRIVNIASRAARMRTGIGNSNYAASKAAVIGFSRVLAGEVGRDGITVNCIAPSRVATPMTLAMADSKAFFEKNIAETAVGRLAEPGDVANAVAWLCAESTGFISGTIIDVNGGSFMP